MKFGYARVSTKSQKLKLQTDALKKEGCEKIFKEKISGVSKERPQLEKLIGQLRKKDIVVVYKLDRLGRSLKDLVKIVSDIQDKGAGLKSINDEINTTTPSGKLTFHLFAALAEFERDIIRERTKAGLEAARARGRVGGRPKGLSKKAQDKAMIAEQLYKEEKLSVMEICEHLSISKMTFYNYLRYRKVKIGSYKRKI